MAWLQNLAGKAEDFLNKIDQNAANVLNESSSSKNLEIAEHMPISADRSLEVKQNAHSNQSSVEILNELSSSGSSFQNFTSADKLNVKDDVVSVASEKSRASENEEDGIYIDFSPTKLVKDLVQEGNVLERSMRTETSLSSKSSRHNSFHLIEDLQTNYEDRIIKLESDNQNLNKQLLNWQHLYSELQQENGNLQNQIARANESVTLAQNEMEQYKARAQRILLEKEKLILVQAKNNSEENLTDGNVIVTYNEELKKELEFQQEKNKDLIEKNASLNSEFILLQQQYVSTQNNNKHSIQSLQESLDNEKRIRIIAEEECRVKTKELQSVLLELSNQQLLVKNKCLELDDIKNQLKEFTSRKPNDDAESRLQILTQTLMAKQNTLETVTTERNALKIQMEKLENEYHTFLMQNERKEVVISNINDTDDAKSQVPRLMVVSPFDAGVTRRVKHAYSTLDAVSIRTGVFLRRYPLARIFVFCYMILLHIWMLIVLYTYVP